MADGVEGLGLTTDAAFDAPVRDAAAIDAEVLQVSISGFEGPLDLLLTMARAQKVDLRRISVLELAEQYLGFVERARALRIELAADYLVMAAWLAYLKSRLLLPQDETGDEPTAEELAAHLAFQLERLEAMRQAAARLMARDRLGQDVFARGEPEAVRIEREITWEASLADLLNAYSRIRTRDEYCPLHIDRSEIFTMDQAVERLKGLIGEAMADWGRLSGFLPEGWRSEPAKRRSALASTFAASLELAKEGRIELRQDGVFAPLYLRRREER